MATVTVRLCSQLMSCPDQRPLWAHGEGLESGATKGDV